MAIDTKQVANRRKVHYSSLEDILSDIDRIEEAHRQGTLQTMGNWSAGQILSHVAAWIEYGYVGYPVKSPPWFIRWILKGMLKKYLKNGMPSGVKIPGIQAGTTGMDEAPLEAASERLRQALRRLQAGEECPYDSPAFGKMSHDDRIRLNLRHAELHLSFLSW